MWRFQSQNVLALVLRSIFFSCFAWMVKSFYHWTCWFIQWLNFEVQVTAPPDWSECRSFNICVGAAGLWKAEKLHSFENINKSTAGRNCVWPSELWFLLTYTREKHNLIFEMFSLWQIVADMRYYSFQSKAAIIVQKGYELHATRSMAKCVNETALH